MTPGGTGRTRPSHEDLVLLLMANAGVIAATGDAAPDAWRRVVAYMVQAFGAAQAGPLPPAPSGDALYEAMARLVRSNGENE